MAEVANLNVKLSLENASFISGMENASAAGRRLLERLDPLAKATRQYRDELDRLDNELKSSRVTTEQHALYVQRLTQEYERNAQRAQNVVGAAGNMKAGMQQLSFQLGDVAQGFAAGTSPMVIFAQQGGQVIQAIGLMVGEAKGFLGFLGGPWGQVIVAATMLLTPFISKLLDSGDASKKAKDDVDDLAKAIDRLNQSTARRTFGDLIEAKRLETLAFTKINEAKSLPGSTREQMTTRRQAIEDAEKQYQNAQDAVKATQIAVDASARLEALSAKAIGNSGGSRVSRSSASSAEAKAELQAEKEIAREREQQARRLSELLDRLYPDRAKGREFAQNVSDLDKGLQSGQLSAEAFAEANQKLADSFTAIKWPELKLQPMSEKVVLELRSKNQIIAESFAKTARTIADTTRDINWSIRNLVDGIRSGDWIDVLAGLAETISKILTPIEKGGWGLGSIFGGGGGSSGGLVDSNPGRTLGDVIAQIGPKLGMGSLFGWGGMRSPVLSASTMSASFGAGAGLAEMNFALPHLAGGGSMRIGGRGGIDTNVMSINGVPRAMVSADETVHVTPANDRGRGGDTYILSGNLLTPEFWAQIQAGNAAAAEGGAAIAEARSVRRQHRSLVRG